MRIIILEDEAAHAEAIRRAFEESGTGFDISVVGSLKEYQDAVAGSVPDVALLDLVVPDGRAVELLRPPAEEGPFPILIMTSFGSEQIAVEALKAGALDYVVKSPEAFTAMPRTVLRVMREWTLLQERRQAEEQLRRVNEELEIRVRERTQELQHAYADLKRESDERILALEALREQEQLMMQQNRLAAMGEMIANIAHQWRQPLNILGLLVQELPVHYAHDEYLLQTKDKAMEVISRMSHTIDDFRNFFKPEKGKAPFTLQNVVKTTVSMLKGSFDQNRIEILIHEEDIATEGYPNELSQVILNILMNAKDVFQERLTPNPQIEIRIYRDEGRPTITISDNAGGIGDDVIEKIFDPYFTTKGPDKGTGIGLFMSRTIVEKSLNGTLSARNTGKGAEFRIVLPEPSRH